jgi:type II secretory pathway pseudopilin PulG
VKPPSSILSWRAFRRRAHTLPEVLVSMGVFSLVIAALVASQLLGVRFYRLAATKLTATTGCREAMNAIRDQVRSSQELFIGNCDSSGLPSSFVSDTNGVQQTGNAIKILTTTNATPYLLFYLDTSTGTNYLKKFDSATTNIDVIASFITNRTVFTAEDYQRTTLTSNDYRATRVIHMVLQFSQWQYPVATIGGGTTNGANVYDYFQLQTRATRRAVRVN